MDGTSPIITVHPKADAISDFVMLVVLFFQEIFNGAAWCNNKLASRNAGGCQGQSANPPNRHRHHCSPTCPARVDKERKVENTTPSVSQPNGQTASRVWRPAAQHAKKIARRPDTAWHNCTAVGTCCQAAQRRTIAPHHSGEERSKFCKAMPGRRRNRHHRESSTYARL